MRHVIELGGSSRRGLNRSDSGEFERIPANQRGLAAPVRANPRALSGLGGRRRDSARISTTRLRGRVRLCARPFCLCVVSGRVAGAQVRPRPSINISIIDLVSLNGVRRFAMGGSGRDAGENCSAARAEAREKPSRDASNSNSNLDDSRKASQQDGTGWRTDKSV